MFRKLVSNLPFQPSLLGDIAFYTNRLQKENVIRRLGVILLLIGFGLQIFTITFPPQSSLATNRSDIVYGASSKSDVLSAYRRNEDQLGRKDIRAIYNHYGIGESQITNSKKVVIKDGSDNYINTSRSTTKWADTFVPIKGAVDGGIYEFPLSYWRKDQYPNGYPALTGLTSYGYRFWILLKGCGNIVYEKGAKKPRLEITKDRTTSFQALEGSNVNYTIRFRNSGAIASKDTFVVDTLPKGVEYKSYSSTADLSFSQDGNKLTWKLKGKNGRLPATSNWQEIKLKATAKQPSTTKLCNSVIINASNGSKVTASKDETCIKIQEKTCPGTGLPIPPEGEGACIIRCQDGTELPYNKICPIPQLSCSELTIDKERLWNERIITVNVIKQSGSDLSRVVLYINGASVKDLDKVSESQYSTKYIFGAPGEFSVQAKLIAKAGNVQENNNCTVVELITKPEIQEAIIVKSKAVSNLTQGLDDANNTTANAGDTLSYNLVVANRGTKKVSNLELNSEYAEDVRDILEYADIKELNDGVLNESTGKISWGKVDIEPGQEVTKTFTVMVKDPLPATPISSSNPLSYDFSMHNEYGNTVVINLSKPLSKEVEEAVAVLPSTGPSSTTLLMSALVIIMGYFYFRNRLLAKELMIIQKEFQTGGF